MAALRPSTSKEVNMRLIKCKRCGAEVMTDGKEQCYCAVCRTAIKAASTVRDRICIDCGRTFPGGPRAKRCPECRAVRSRIMDAAHKRIGAARKLGSIDRCERCGAEYTVKSGRQKYCPDCAGEAVRQTVADHKREFYRDRADEYADRKRALKKDRKVCVVCGKLFNAPVSVTCSEECAKIHKSNQQKKFDALRPNRQKKENKS